jgi:hypothetical protein
VLQQLPPDEDSFTAMIANFHIARGHLKFRLPALAGELMQLRSVLLDVLARGGCQAVTQRKRWKDVVRSWALWRLSAARCDACAKHLAYRCMYIKSMRDQQVHRTVH